MKPIDNINIISEPMRRYDNEQSPSAANPAPLARPGETALTESLMGQIVLALRQVFDPEIPVNIYDLGLIYDLQINPEGDVEVAIILSSNSFDHP